MFDFQEEFSNHEKSFDFLEREDTRINSSFIFSRSDSFDQNDQINEGELNIREFQNIPQTPTTILPKKNHLQKKKNKKDDFNYDQYIKEELAKLNTENMDKFVKKKLI